MIVRKLQRQDILDILYLVQTVHIKNLNCLDNGFLMIPNASYALYQSWMAMSQFCYVAQERDSVIGVLAALPGGGCGLDGKAWSRVGELAAGAAYLAVVQVAVEPACQRRGIGSQMYERLFSDAAGTVIFSSSMKKPYNRASERFHEKAGFERVEEFLAGDGTEAIIWRWKSENTGQKPPEVRTFSGGMGGKE